MNPTEATKFSCPPRGGDGGSSQEAMVSMYSTTKKKMKKVILKYYLALFFFLLANPKFSQVTHFPMRKGKERNPVRHFQLFHRPDGSGHGDDWKYLQLVTLLGVTEATHKSHSAQEPLKPWEFIVTPSKIPEVLLAMAS